MREFMRGQLAHQDGARFIELAVVVASALGMRLRQTLECPEVRIPWCHRCPSTRMGYRASVHGMRGHDLVLGLFRLLTRPVERRGDVGVQLRVKGLRVRAMSASTYSTGESWRAWISADASAMVRKANSTVIGMASES